MINIYPAIYSCVNVVQIYTFVCYKKIPRDKKNSSYSPYQTAPPLVLSPRSPWLGGIPRWLSSSSCRCHSGCTVVYTSGYTPPVRVVRVQWWPSAHRSNLWRHQETLKLLSNHGGLWHMLNLIYYKIFQNKKYSRNIQCTCQFVAKLKWVNLFSRVFWILSDNTFFTFRVVYPLTYNIWPRNQ